MLPSVTDTVPEGEMEPPVPAEAVMVYVVTGFDSEHEASSPPAVPLHDHVQFVELLWLLVLLPALQL
ncbi:MAG: hypothetical protein A2064_10740 [Spirochaetes bacterium GWB1_66_5]|nr:MAG: hypothetical protein A2064_10740 [Spirochaetes bacterium GWB1_66_5]